MIRLESDHSMKLQDVDLTLTSNSSISKFIRCFVLLISNSRFNFIHEMYIKTHQERCFQTYSGTSL